jgi:hypothetical protein
LWSFCGAASEKNLLKNTHRVNLILLASPYAIKFVAFRDFCGNFKQFWKNQNFFRFFTFSAFSL